MAAAYRKLTTSSYQDAVNQLKTGEKLVVANTGAANPRNGHIPVTSETTYDDHKSCDFYARTN